MTAKEKHWIEIIVDYNLKAFEKLCDKHLEDEKLGHEIRRIVNKLRK